MLGNVGSIAKGLEHYGPVSWSQIIMYLRQAMTFLITFLATELSTCDVSKVR